MIKDPEKQAIIKNIQIKPFVQRLVQKKVTSYNTKMFKKLFYCKNVENYIKLKKTAKCTQLLSNQ